jgi:hypothetical protein
VHRSIEETNDRSAQERRGPQQIMNMFLATPPLGRPQPTDAGVWRRSTATATHGASVEELPRNVGQYGDREMPRSSAWKYGDRHLSRSLACEALRVGRGRWQDIIYALVPGLSWRAQQQALPFNIRGQICEVSLRFSSDLVHVQIDGVWFDLDGIQALQILDGYGPWLAAEMVVEWAQYYLGARPRNRRSR